MRKAFSVIVFVLFGYLSVELLYMAFTGNYSVPFTYILDVISDLIEKLSALNSPDFFDWTWFLLLLINVVIALIITFFFSRRYKLEQKNKLVTELEANVDLMNQEIQVDFEDTEPIKKVRQIDPIIMEEFSPDLDNKESIFDGYNEPKTKEEYTIVTHVKQEPIVKSKEVRKSIRKTEISQIVSNRTSLSEYKAMQAINNIIEIVEDELNENSVITIPRLGKFNKKHRNSRSGTNPSTGLPLLIKEHNTVTYKPDEWLKEYINKEIHKSKKHQNYFYKTDLLELVYRRTGFSKQSLHDSLNIMLEFITENISQGVDIEGIGKFSLKNVLEHRGVNPKTKEELVIPEHNKVVFKYSPLLKAYVNKEIKRKPIGKTEIVETIISKTGLSKNKSRNFLNELLTLIEDELLEHNEFSLNEVGKFERVFSEARKGINPKTKEVMYIKSHYKVKFKPFKALKEKVKW